MDCFQSGSTVLYTTCLIPNSLQTSATFCPCKIYLVLLFHKQSIFASIYTNILPQILQIKLHDWLVLNLSFQIELHRLSKYRLRNMLFATICEIHHTYSIGSNLLTFDSFITLRCKSVSILINFSQLVMLK